MGGSTATGGSEAAGGSNATGGIQAAGGSGAEPGEEGPGGSTGGSGEEFSGGSGGTGETAGACSRNPCKNGGTCADVGDGYGCRCKAGFKGEDCEVNIDECVNNDCEHGTCVDGVAGYTCQCDDRHAGPACDLIEFKLSGSVFGDDETQVTAISGDGSVVLLNSSGDNGDNVARLVDFDSLTAVDLGMLKATARWGYGISGNGGVIAGQALSGDRYVPFLFEVDRASYPSMSPPLPNGSAGIAYDVSSDGATIVGSWSEEDTGKIRAFRYNNQVAEYVGAPGSDDGHLEARAVSGDGSVVAGLTWGTNGLAARAWRWTLSGKKTVDLQMLATTWRNPSVGDISKDGRVVVGSVVINGVVHAVRWVGDTGAAEDLGPGALLATNADGSVSVGEDKSYKAAIWTKTLKAQTIGSVIGTNPDAAGADLIQANAVSENGKIVAGTAMITGRKQGWVVRLP